MARSSASTQVVPASNSECTFRSFRGRTAAGACASVLRGILALAFLAVPGFVEAQPADRPDPRLTARAHIGTLYITPAIELEELGIDTNVFNALEDPKSDFTFTLSPKVEVALPLARRALIRATPGADVIYYHTFDSQRSISPEISVRADVYAGRRFTLFAAPSMLHLRRRPSLEIDARAEHSERAIEAGIIAAMSRRLSIEAKGRESRVEFDEREEFLGVRLRDQLDRTSRSVSLTTGYRLSPLTMVFLTGEAITDRFAFADDRDADSVRVVSGIQFRPRALITGHATIGMRRFQTLTDSVPDFQGLVTSAALGYTMMGATNLSFTADRDVAYSFEIRQPYYVVDSYGVRITQHIAGRIDGGVGAGRHQYSYRNVSPASTPSEAIDKRVDRTWNYTALVSYRVNPTMRVGLTVTYWERQSSSYGFRNYDAFRIGTTLIYGSQP